MLKSSYLIDNYNIIVKKVKPLKIKINFRLEKTLSVRMDFHVSFKILLW